MCWVKSTVNAEAENMPPQKTAVSKSGVFIIRVNESVGGLFTSYQGEFSSDFSTVK